MSGRRYRGWAPSHPRSRRRLAIALLGLLALSGSAAGAGVGASVAPAHAPSYIFLNLTSSIATEPSAPRSGWTGETAVGHVGGSTYFVTVGVRGLAVFNGSTYPRLANLSNAGGLNSVAFGAGRFLVGGSLASSNGALLYAYYPRNQTLANLSTWFNGRTGNTTALFSIAWNGSAFYLFGGRPNLSAGGYIGNLYRYDPITGSLASLAKRLPAGFRSLGSCCGENEILATPAGLLMTVWSTASATFGELRWNGSFVDLSSSVASTFETCLAMPGPTPASSLGICQGLGSDAMAWDGRTAWLVGIDRNPSTGYASLLYAIDPYNATVAPVTTAFSPSTQHPITIAFAAKRVYLAGYATTNSTKLPHRPFLLMLDPTTLGSHDLSRLVPSGVIVLETVAAAGRSVYYSGAAGPVQEGLLVPT